MCAETPKINQKTEHRLCETEIYILPTCPLLEVPFRVGSKLGGWSYRGWGECHPQSKIAVEKL